MGCHEPLHNRSLIAAGEIPFSPRSDDWYLWRQGLDGQLKTHLVIAFTGAAVTDSIAVFFQGNIYQIFGDQRPGHGCPQKIFAFIDSVCFEGGEDIIFDEFSSQVANIAFRCPQFQGFGFDCFHIITLADIATDCDYFTAIVLF